MPREVHNQLSELKIRSCSCPTDKPSIDFRDGTGLILRASKSGRKTWRYEYRSEGKKKSLSLGTYPKISLKSARNLRQKAIDLRNAGLDPVEQSKINKNNAKQEQLQQILVAEQAESEPTIQDLIHEYMLTLSDAPSAYGVRRSLKKDVSSVWRSRKASSITRRECVLLLDNVKQRAPVQANRLYAYMSSMFKVGIKRGLIESDPMSDVAKPAPQADHHNNTHKALTTAQLRTLIAALETTPFEDVIRLMLLTGARPKEILAMRWKQLYSGRWTLGPGEHKAGHRRARTIERPLLPDALAIIDKYKGCHKELVFPGPKGTPMATTSLGHFVSRQRNHFGIEGFTSHHIRHTMATRMREIGIAPHIAERILGHVVDTGIAGVYSSYDWLPEMKSALEKWYDWLEEYK